MRASASTPRWRISSFSCTRSSQRSASWHTTMARLQCFRTMRSSTPPAPVPVGLLPLRASLPPFSVSCGTTDGGAYRDRISSMRRSPASTKTSRLYCASSSKPCKLPLLLLLLLLLPTLLAADEETRAMSSSSCASWPSFSSFA